MESGDAEAVSGHTERRPLSGEATASEAQDTPTRPPKSNSTHTLPFSKTVAETT